MASFSPPSPAERAAARADALARRRAILDRQRDIKRATTDADREVATAALASLIAGYEAEDRAALTALGYYD